MKHLGATTYGELLTRWLRSEWYRLSGTPDYGLIAEAGPGDPAQHDRRLQLLRSIRQPILDELPIDGSIAWVDIEPGDLPELFIIPCFDWYLDTGGTFKLTDTQGNLRAGRGNVWEPGYIDNRARTDSVAPYVERYSAHTTTEILVLVSVHETGPYTIVDGTHRAAALYEAHQVAANMPWRAILLRDARVADSPWYIESSRAQANLRTFASYATNGQIW
jgi:hypothetical protein